MLAEKITDVWLATSEETKRFIDIVQGCAGFVTGKWANNKILKQRDKKGMLEIRIN